MTRLPRGVGDAPLVGVETEQSGQQSNRLVLDVLRERLKSAGVCDVDADGTGSAASVVLGVRTAASAPPSAFKE
ncbi:MAG TPA: hypothetical protein VGX46_19275 [Vicinamibacterales bacterium]|nr:hypothetical protein [Vicinamibacterales bacterium]